MPDTPDDRISYNGPDLTYTPSIGNNQKVSTRTITTSSGSYASKEILQDDLNNLFKELDEFRGELEYALVTRGLPITPLDSRLKESHEIEWPTSLGEPKQYVSYRYYKYLGLQNTTASKILQKKFEQASRDIGGTPALDLLTLVDSMQNEATLIREFSKTYVGQLTDAAEHRTVELFQDWAQSALYHTGNFRKLFQTGISSTLPQDELETLSSSEARNSQAVFKIKLNDVNTAIDSAQEYLNKNFTQYAPLFYGNFLAPALQFRLNVSRKFFPSNGVLGEELGRVTKSLDANLSMLQGDQMRRNAIFDKKANELYGLLQEQGAYKNFIEQLSPTGQSLPSPGLIEVQDDDEEIQFFAEAEETEPASNISIASPHNLLLGREDEAAHPQYYLKSGDTLTGDLLLEDGVKVDGIVPHTHKHDGLDGSAKIEGTDIVGGTLNTDTINRSEFPDRPTNLHLDSSTVKVTPPGISSIDVVVAWDGDPELQYEIQIVAV